MQQPCPPVFLGCDAGPSNFRHIAEWGDGWYPSRHFNRIESSIKDLRLAFEAAGRAGDSARVMVCTGDPNALSGDGVDLELLDRLQLAGVECAILPLPSGTRDAQAPILDRFAAVIDRYS